MVVVGMGAMTTLPNLACAETRRDSRRDGTLTAAGPRHRPKG